MTVFVVKIKKNMLIIDNILIAISVISSVEILTKCQAAHIHTYQQKIGSNERTQDGAFSPRDRDHFTDGNHHQEFDHEAIIG